MRPTARNTGSIKPHVEYKVFTKDGKELFAYTVYGEGEDEEEATIGLLAYENHCQKSSIHVHREWREST